MKYEQLKDELEQEIADYEHRLIADSGARPSMGPWYSINAYALLEIIEELEQIKIVAETAVKTIASRVDFSALGQERKDKVLAQIDDVRNCADAEVVVELSLERYLELLRKSGVEG
jgi:hypothetical protein